MQEINIFLERVRSNYFLASDYWPRLREIWDQSKTQDRYFGNDLENRDKNLSEIFSNFPETRTSFMTETECEKLEDLPETVTVYRGGQQTNIAGWSWTLDKNVAKRIGCANASDNRPLLATVTDLPSGSVLALIENLDFEELIIDPLTITLETAELANISFERIET
tara:strand:+ start:460 stop:957 length:498 start_codon:yes stop_codon:yes gene_type:complete